MLDHNHFNLYLIRHGESEFNITPERMGQFPDTALTEHGRQQAKLLGKRLEGLKIDHLYSSDYKRAFDTCNIAMGHQRAPTVSEALREYSAGDWDGKNRYETITPEVKIRMGLMANGFCPPGGESMHMVERRASQWLEDTILYNKSMIESATQRKKRGEKPMNIVAFSHGMTIKCLLHYVMGFDQAFTWKLTLENTSISQLVFSEEGWRLLTINDHAHLL